MTKLCSLSQTPKGFFRTSRSSGHHVAKVPTCSGLLKRPRRHSQFSQFPAALLTAVPSVLVLCYSSTRNSKTKSQTPGISRYNKLLTILEPIHQHTHSNPASISFMIVFAIWVYDSTASSHNVKPRADTGLLKMEHRNPMSAEGFH